MLKLWSVECVIDRGVNSGLHAKLLIHLWSSKGLLRSERPEVGIACRGDMSTSPCKTPPISPTARSGEAEAKWALTQMETGEAGAGASPLSSPRQKALAVPCSRDPPSPQPECLSQPSCAHFMHLSVGLNHRNCFPSPTVQHSASFSTSFFLSWNKCVPKSGSDSRQHPWGTVLSHNLLSQWLLTWRTRWNACRHPMPTHTPTLRLKPQLWAPVRSSPRLSYQPKLPPLSGPTYLSSSF